MIWSIMPEDFLFDADPQQEQLLQCSYLGRQLLVKPVGNGQGQIMSLLSTDPADFLDARFQAGRLMSMEN